MSPSTSLHRSTKKASTSIDRRPPLYASTMEPETKTEESALIEELTKAQEKTQQEIPTMTDELMQEIQLEAEKAVEEMMEETCEVDEDTGGPKDEICADAEKRIGFRSSLKLVISKTMQVVRGSTVAAEMEAVDENVSEGELLERGWEKRANSSALLRNAEVWKFALASVFRVLKPRKMKLKGATDEEIKAAQVEAAEFIRNGLLKLGPSFVKVRNGM